MKADKYIVNWMLQYPMRDYVINKIKAPMMKAIIILARRYPEPTHENCVQPNSHILIDLRDKFFAYEDNSCRTDLFHALWRILIDEYEHDHYYGDRIDFLAEEIIKAYQEGKWQPRQVGRPKSNWKELQEAKC